MAKIFGAKIQIHKLKINVPHNKGNVVKKWDLSCGYSNSVTTNDVYGPNNSFLPFPDLNSSIWDSKRKNPDLQLKPKDNLASCL